MADNQFFDPTNGARITSPNDQPEGLALGSNVTLDLPSAALSPNQAPANQVAAWRGEARPIEVALTVTQPSAELSGGFPPGSATGFAGQVFGGISTHDSPFDAFWVLEYGRGGFVRRRVIDLRSGIFYLGVCDQVTVIAKRWRGSTVWATGQVATVFVNAAIQKPSGGAYDEMTCSQLIRIPAATAASSRNIAGVYGACAFEFDLAAAWGTAEPAFTLASGDSSIRVLYDIANAKITPPFRRFQMPVSVSNLALVLTWSAVTVADVNGQFRWILSP